MRKYLALAALLAGLWTCPVANADIGGYVPGPGQCDYPMVGSQGMEFGVYHYECHGPTEINGSHWQSFYGGAAAQGTIGASAGVNIAFLNVGINASLQSAVGVLEGVQYWACPDLSVAEQPNPIGAYGQAITPSKCKTVGPKPPFLTQPPPDQPVGPPNPLAPPPPAPTTGGNNADPTPAN